MASPTNTLKQRNEFFSKTLVFLLFLGAFITSGTAFSQDNVTNVFLPAPRILKQQLGRAKRAIDEENYSDAVTFLGQILTHSGEIEPMEAVEDANNDAVGQLEDSEAESQDFFIEPDEEDGTFRSIKVEANRLLGQLPDDALKLYDLQYGADARALLRTSLENNDLAGLTQVTRKYFHTASGYEAAMLLGRSEMARGRPLTAALGFRRIYQTPAARKRFDPELSLLLAVCWDHARLQVEAREVLMDLKAKYPDTQFTIGNQPISIFGADENPIEWLRNIASRSGIADTSGFTQWVMFRGTPTRNAASKGGIPLQASRWRIRTAVDSIDEQRIREILSSSREQSNPELPSLHPLIVNDIVLTRTPERLIAVNFKTGKRVWEFPWFNTRDEEELLQSQLEVTEGASHQRQNELKQRLWQDNPYGQLASDEKSVYVLWEMGFADFDANNTRRLMMAPGGAQVNIPGGPRSTNYLSGLDLETEGSLKWIVGGASGEDEPRLAGAFFLGAPLPLFGQLYVLAELNGEIRLCVLDADSGHQVWSQQLAHMDNQRIVFDRLRRLAGATPSFGDGVLICPTSAGAVVAVDIANRSLLWGFQYNTNRQSKNNFPFNPNTSSSKPTTRWQDSSVTIADSKVLLTPVEGNDILCLDLVSGKLLWKRKRDTDMYIATAHEKLAVSVATKKVVAYKLADGEPAWELPLDDGNEMPSGRGFRTGNSYFLPTTSNRLLEFDVLEGKVLSTTDFEDELGNMICYKDQVISQTPLSLNAYYQIEPLRKRVSERLDDNKSDVWALARHSELLLHDGDYTAALESLRKTHEASPDSASVRRLLAHTMLKLIESDYAGNQGLATEIEPLLDTRVQRQQFLTALAQGLQGTDKHLDAFNAYMELITFVDDQREANSSGYDELQRIEPGLRVRYDRWIRNQITALMASANADQLTAIDNRIGQMLNEAVENKEIGSLREFLRYFDAHQSGAQARLELSRLLVSHGDRLNREFIEAELHLVMLEEHSDDTVAMEALYLQLQLLEKLERFEAASVVIGKLATRFPDTPVVDELTGTQLLQQYQAKAETAAALTTADPWAGGHVEHEKINETNNRVPSFQRIYAIPVFEQSGPLVPRTLYAHNQSSNSIVVRSPTGKTIQQVSISDGTPTYGSQYGIMYCKSVGHYLMVFTGRDLIVVDTLHRSGDPADAILWRKKLQQSTNQRIAPPIRSRAEITPWGVRQYQALDPNGRKLGETGSISIHGIVLQRGEQVYCVDALDGSTIWVRDGITTGCEIYSNNEVVTLVPPDPEQAAIQLNLIDGSHIQSVEGGNRQKRFLARNATSFVYESKDENVTIGKLDVLSQQMQWQYSFPNTARGTLIGLDKMAIMTPDGKLTLLNLNDGSEVFRRQLLPEDQLTNIFIIESKQHLMLVTSRPLNARGITVPSVGMQARMINGNVYCLDRNTGEFNWPSPSRIQGWALPMNQPADSPVLTFVRQVNSVSSEDRRRTTMHSEIFCMDKRDGRELMSPQQITGYIRAFDVTSEASKQLVTVTANTNINRFRFTDDPTPPAAPVQKHDGTGATAKAVNNFSKQLFKALGKPEE